MQLWLGIRRLSSHHMSRRSRILRLVFSVSAGVTCASVMAPSRAAIAEPATLQSKALSPTSPIITVPTSSPHSNFIVRFFTQIPSRIMYIIRKTQDIFYHHLVRVLEWSGPTFIKLGQWAATRPDILPPYFCTKLSILHSQVSSGSFAQSRKTIEDELKMPIEQIFREVEEIPIGAGCIAQVYLATLLDGRKVVVKVRRPGVVECVQRDCAIMCSVASVLSFIPLIHFSNLHGTIQVFMESMRQQMDLTVEAQNLQQFQRDFANEANVRFPSPIFPWVRPAVLVESFEEGIKMTHLLDQVASKSLPWWLDQALCAKIPQIGIKAFFSMVFKFHLVHADLHPGNILVRFPRREAELSAKLSRCPQQDFQINSRAVSRSDSEPHLQTPLPAQQLDTVNLDSLQEVELVFMDAGLVARLDSDQRKNFVDLFEALAGCNGHQAAEMMIARSPQAVLPPLEDQEMFKLEMDRIVRENLWGGKTTFQLNKVNFAGILIECATLSRKYHVQLDAAYASVMVGALVMEGMGRQLNADLNLFDIARPILLENYKSIFSLVSWSERLSTTKLFISDFWTNLRGESV